MSANHLWFECRPTLLMIEHPLTAEMLERGDVALRKVWLSMRDSERHRFHRFACEGDRSFEAQAVVTHMVELLNHEGIN